jgi:sialidase-1
MKQTLFALGLAAGCVFAATRPVSVDVFTSGSEGYHTFRIPAIVTAQDGTLLAFAEGRKENRSDPGGGDIDLVLKRSRDRGASWSPLVVLDDPGLGWAASNPTPVLDRRTGRLWVFYNRWEPGRGTASSRPGAYDNQAWARSSDDHGATWSEAVDLTQVARDIEHWGAMFFGPGGAIQTRAGRILVPAAMRPDSFDFFLSIGGFTGRTSLMRAYVLYSDDGGVSWRRSALLRAQTDENQLVELADGAILMDARQGAGEHRWLAFSFDGGATWSDPVPGQNVTPISAAIERYSYEGEAEPSRILWTGPAGPGRRRLVVRLSYDEGQTFSVERLLYGGLAAYSDLAVLNDRSIGVFWERGVSQPYQFLTFTRIGIDFLEAGVVGSR